MKNWDKTEPMLDDVLLHRQKIEEKIVFFHQDMWKKFRRKRNLKKILLMFR